MKRKVSFLNQTQKDHIFAPIRNKKDLVGIMIQAIKVMLIDGGVEESAAAAKIVLVVDKMSRMFFCSDEKMFSINFPFVVSLDEGGCFFYSREGFPVDSKATSLLMSVLHEHVYSSSDVEEFAYSIMEINDEYGGEANEFWRLFKEVLLFEDGYIRFDFDVERQDVDYHPLSHFDLYYSTGNTFKVGLYNKIAFEDFYDILNVRSNVYYLSNYSKR